MSSYPDVSKESLLVEAKRNLSDGTYELFFNGTSIKEQDRITPDYRYGPEFHVKEVHNVDARSIVATVQVVTYQELTSQLRDEVENWLVPGTSFKIISTCIGEFDPH